MAVDWSIPHWRQRGRRTTARARRLGAILAPEMASSTKLSRLPVANQVFLGSWMVDICQEGRSLRSAPQRRHGTPKTVLSQCTWETEQPGLGR